MFRLLPDDSRRLESVRAAAVFFTVAPMVLTGPAIIVTGELGWILSFMSSVLFWGAVAWYADRRLTRARRREAGQCESCGYNLHALESDCCAECGMLIRRA